MKKQTAQSAKVEKLSIEVILTIGEETFTTGYDLTTLKEPLTERRFEECYRFLCPSVARVLCDRNKIINPDVWD